MRHACDTVQTTAPALGRRAAGPPGVRQPPAAVRRRGLRLGLAALALLCLPYPCGSQGLRDELQRTTEALAAVDSRVTGYPGAAQAATWLRQELRRAGVAEVYAQRFQVPIPVDEGFWLEEAEPGAARRASGVPPPSAAARGPADPGAGVTGRHAARRGPSGVASAAADPRDGIQGVAPGSGGAEAAMPGPSGAPPAAADLAGGTVGLPAAPGAQAAVARPVGGSPFPEPTDPATAAPADTARIRLYGVWPNLVRTSTAPQRSLWGRLLDLGRGEPRDWAGRDPADRIVLLDYDSGRAWLDAFELGARAVVFLESGPSHRKEAELKFLGVPAALPRYFAAAADTARLRDLARQAATVAVWGSMPWRQVEGETLVGLVPGSDPELAQEAVFVGAHYDAMSPVPALAPGAEQACSAAALLELAHVLAARPPRRTVLLVFTAGHYEMLAGARHLADLLEALRDGSGMGAQAQRRGPAAGAPPRRRRGP
ncbi:MAG: M28 family peptidase, partial [Candidatus Latescibacterota bacterium]